jgi:hypothetical protein
MNIIVIVCGLAGFCLVLWDFCQRLPAEQTPFLRRWFKNWMLKGLLAPFLLWMAFNSAQWNWLPPLLPEVEFAKLNGDLAAVMPFVATLGLFVIGSYWAAVTVAWLLVVLGRQAADARQFRSCVLVWSAILAPVAVLITMSYGWRLAGLGATLWLLPILQQVLALQPEHKVAPVYSRAIAAIHFDKYEEAERAVLHELETCQDDFDGWMMLADLYANQFNDLPAAQKLIHDTCEHPATTPSNFAVACHRLADWQLKLAQDPDAARASLMAIGRRYPRSHLDRMARLRINQLPPNREALLEQQSVKKIRLTSLHGPPKNASAEAPAPLSRQEAFDRSQQCVARLTSNPDDMAAREELAHLWAEDLDQIDMGVEQLQLLLGMGGATRAKAAEWLGLMASWHLKFPPNPEAARAVMERLVRQYAQSPQGLAAQRRLNVMNIEARMRQSADTRQEQRG